MTETMILLRQVRDRAADVVTTRKQWLRHLDLGPKTDDLHAYPRHIGAMEALELALKNLDDHEKGDGDERVH
jgi:hypothetical protein